MMAPYWAVARLKAGQEGLALHSLARIGYETYFPRTIEKRSIRGRQIVRAIALFPSYVFVQIEVQWHAARWAYGVAALILDGVAPAKVPEHEIASLRSRERDGFIVLQPPPKSRSLRRGDSVRVTAGPLIGFNGWSRAWPAAIASSFCSGCSADRSESRCRRAMSRRFRRGPVRGV